MGRLECIVSAGAEDVSHGLPAWVFPVADPEWPHGMEVSSMIPLAVCISPQECGSSGILRGSPMFNVTFCKP